MTVNGLLGIDRIILVEPVVEMVEQLLAGGQVMAASRTLSLVNSSSSDYNPSGPATW